MMILAKWWSEVVWKTQPKLYIWVALCKICCSTKVKLNFGVMNEVTKLRKELNLNDDLLKINGIILFREAYLNKLQIVIR